MLKRTTKPLRRRVLIEEGLAKSSEKQCSENTNKWHLCKAGSFSYSESPRTPPLEGTSLHRWNNSVERPWGILSLFTSCLRLQVNWPCQRLSHRRSGVFAKQAGSNSKLLFFYGESPRTPLFVCKFTRSDETIVWRNPRGSWACLPPVYDCVWNHPATGCDMWTTPKKHTKRRETPENANKNKTTRRAGFKVYEKNPPKEAFTPPVKQ